MIRIKLENYFDLLVDAKIDNITNSPICIGGIDNIINEIYLDLKSSITKGQFQTFIGEYFPITTFLSWKNGVYPIPIVKLKQLLSLWESVCDKSLTDVQDLYNTCFQESINFRAMNSPIKIHVIKEITPELSYFLGLLYADGSLRNIWLTFEKEKRFRWEITITDESPINLERILPHLEKIFGIKTNVKKVYAGRWHRILFQSMILHRLLNNLFEMPMGFKKGRLRIPKLISNSSFEIKSKFVSGFFDGDGWVNKNKNTTTPTICFSQSSKNILEDIHKILLEKNLEFRFQKRKSNNYDYYNLITKNKNNIRKFQEFFGSQHSQKKERLSNLIKQF